LFGQKHASGFPMDEKDLLKECLSGNTRAQKLLYERYSPKMFGVCLRYASDRSMAEDFLQEGFIRVFMKLGSFKSQGSLEGWMRRIMVNTALEILRKKDILRNSVELTFPNQHHGGLQEGLHTEPEADEDANDDITGQISADILHQTISEMPVGFRTVFNLYAVENYTHKEIANLVGISEGTSKSQFARARVWLQKRLNENNRFRHAGQ